MAKQRSDFRNELLQDLADPREAAGDLNAALEEAEDLLHMARRDVAETRQNTEGRRVFGEILASRRKSMFGRGGTAIGVLTSIAEHHNGSEEISQEQPCAFPCKTQRSEPV